MLKIRLARGGAKKRPYYSIVIADSHSPRDGRFIEKVGSYNPLLKKDDPQRIVLKVERIQEWMAKGAQPTDRVARELSLQGIGAWQHGANPNKGQPGTKAKERAEERAQREADRAAAAAAAAGGRLFNGRRLDRDDGGLDGFRQVGEAGERGRGVLRREPGRRVVLVLFGGLAGDRHLQAPREDHAEDDRAQHQQERRQVPITIGTHVGPISFRESLLVISFSHFHRSKRLASQIPQGERSVAELLYAKLA